MAYMTSHSATTGIEEDFVAGNYFDKYKSRNPLHRLLVRNFVKSARELLFCSRPGSVLEVGCGDGKLAGQILPIREDGFPDGMTYVGTDLSREQVGKACILYPRLGFQQASIYALPFRDQAFDLVVACEVFEHLCEPWRAIAEVERVCRRFLLLSVPWEPWWRLLNILRGQYVSDWGNTPGHIQHFSRKGIRTLVSSRFKIIMERMPFPWTMLLARRKL